MYKDEVFGLGGSSSRDGEDPTLSSPPPANAKLQLQDGELSSAQKERMMNSILVGKMEAGDSFGETALITSTPRSASIVTTSPSIFACLHASDYSKILKRWHEEQLTELNAFLEKMSFFR
jgi:CRP-like cAMP-binding protein